MCADEVNGLLPLWMLFQTSKMIASRGTMARLLLWCVNAPMMQINDDYYEDLTADGTTAVLAALAKGERPAVGPQGGRHASEPAGGPTTLHEFTSRDARGEG